MIDSANQSMGDRVFDIVEKIHRLRNDVTMAKLNAAFTMELEERLQIAADILTKVEKVLMEIEGNNE